MGCGCSARSLPFSDPISFLTSKNPQMFSPSDSSFPVFYQSYGPFSYRNLWDATKAVLKGKFTVINTNIEKEVLK